MTNLHGKFGVAVGVYPIHNAFPRLRVLRRVEARAAGGDAPLSADAGHLSEYQGRAAQRAGTQVHQVVVTRYPVHRRVLRHGGHDDAVFQRQAAHGVGREHGRWRGLVVRQRNTGALRKPALEPAEPLGIAQAQILMADALAACEHGVHELRCIQLVAVAHATHLKPFHGVPGGVLQAQHIDVAQGLVARQHLWDVLGGVTPFGELTGQLNRVFNGEFGA